MNRTEFFESVAKNEITDNVIEYAKTEIEKISKKNALASEKRNAELETDFAQILTVLNETPKGASTIAKELDFEMSTSKVSARCIALVKANRITVTEIKGSNGRKINGYSLLSE